MTTSTNTQCTCKCHTCVTGEINHIDSCNHRSYVVGSPTPDTSVCTCHCHGEHSETCIKTEVCPFACSHCLTSFETRKDKIGKPLQAIGTNTVSKGSESETFTAPTRWKKELEDMAVARRVHGGLGLMGGQLNEIEAFIQSLLTKEKTQLLERVEREVIGEDEYKDPNHISNQLKPYLRVEQLTRNGLRKEQRQALAQIKKEIIESPTTNRGSRTYGETLKTVKQIEKQTSDSLTTK